MAISVDYTLTPWLITIPKADLTLDTGTKYNLDVDVFWQLLRDYADSPEGVVSPVIYTRIAATASTPSITEVNDDYYELQFEDGLYSVNIINGNTNIRDVEVKNQVSVNTNNTTGFIDPTFLESGLFGGVVTIDVNLGVSGTGTTNSGGIIGTRQTPSNNLTDAKSIAVTRGFSTIHVNDHITFVATDVLDDLIIEGDNQSQSIFMFTAGASTEGSSFRSACLTGDLSGALFVEDSAMIDLSGVGNATSISRFMDSSFEGGYIRIRADATQEINFISCENGATNAEIDINGSVALVRVQQYSGDLILSNLTAGNTFVFNATAGKLTIDASCTSGTIVIQGDTKYINNGAAVIIDETAARVTWDYPISNITDINSVGYEILEHLHDLHYEGVVWVDSVNGTAGIAHPIGTKLVPVLTIADAVIIANSLGIVDISIIEDVTILATDNVSGLLIYGAHASKSQITLNAGCNTTFTQFTNCQLTGTAGGEIVVRDSVIDDLAGFIGILHQCAINGSVVLSGDGTKSTHILSCYSGVPGASAPELDFNNLNIPIGIRDYNGGIKLVNKTGAADVSIDLNSGQVILNGTVTAGNIVVRGVGKITNTSTADVDDTHLVQQSKLLKFAQYIGLS